MGPRRGPVGEPGSEPSPEPSLEPKPRVLFVCTYNAARSQLAEGLLRGVHGERYEAMSAGTMPTGVNPFAIKALAEIGIDISSHRSKSVLEFSDADIDLVVTVCDSAREACPFFPGGMTRMHRAFEDPGTVTGSDETKLQAFRRTRDEMRSWMDEAFGPGGEARELLEEVWRGRGALD